MSTVSDLCDADQITQDWGCTDYVREWQRSDCAGGHFHAGVDLGYSDGGNNHLGSAIRSPRNGVVVAVGVPWLGPYAPVILSDAEGAYIELGHVQAVYVSVGDRVTAGQHVADLGSLGASSAGHLHVEVRSDGPLQGAPWAAVLDPIPWLNYLDEEVAGRPAEEKAMSVLYIRSDSGEVAAIDCARGTVRLNTPEYKARQAWAAAVKEPPWAQLSDADFGEAIKGLTVLGAPA